jgi:hypothetical protein
LLTTYLFQSKIENYLFAWLWTWEAYRGSEYKAFGILNKCSLERRLGGLCAGLDDVSREGFLFSIAVDHCFCMEKLWRYS